MSVQTAVVYISYANELRLGGRGIAEATREAALLRLRPIMMTALVAAFGLLPAALATGVGTDSQRPFALVIVGGLFSRLLISVFLMPVLYEVAARPGDHLEVTETVGGGGREGQGEGGEGKGKPDAQCKGEECRRGGKGGGLEKGDGSGNGSGEKAPGSPFLASRY